MGYTNAQLDELAKGINLEFDESQIKNEQTFIDKFKEYWVVIKPILDAGKIFVGPKVDEVIDKVVTAGDVIIGEATGNVKEKIKDFTEHWPLVRTPLKLIAQIIPGKKGKAFRQFIKMADIFCEEYAG